MKTGIDWTVVRMNLDAEEWQEQEDECGEERVVFLGSCFSLAPSGKYYQPWACSNVTEEEVDADEVWYEALEVEAAKHNLFVTASEGDPCDIMIGECRDN